MNRGNELDRRIASANVRSFVRQNGVEFRGIPLMPVESNRIVGRSNPTVTGDTTCADSRVSLPLYPIPVAKL